jgi:hypothetical protein
VAYESGELSLASGRAVASPPRGEQVVFERLIAGHTELLVRLAVLVSERYGFAGSWRFGLLVVGLKDKGSALVAEDFSRPSSGNYTDDTYEATTTSALLEMKDSHESVVEALVGQLFRSLGSHVFLDWLPR